MISNCKSAPKSSPLHLQSSMTLNISLGMIRTLTVDKALVL